MFMSNIHICTCIVLVYGFINHMGLDADSDVGLSTPLDPREVYSKMDSPPEIDVTLRDKVWQAHGKLIDLVHSISVLGRYVHNPSERLLNAYSRIAKYLVKTRDLKLVYGTPDIELMDLKPYGHTASDWGGCIDDRKSTGVYIFLLLSAAISWKVKLSRTACLSSQEAGIFVCEFGYRHSSQRFYPRVPLWLGIFYI